MEDNTVFFLEDDFGTGLGKVIRLDFADFKKHNKPKRLITNFYYLFRSFFLPPGSTVIAPWGLFWCAAIPKKWGKDLIIISLSTDTFLSEKTQEAKGFIPRFKKTIATFTYPAVDYWFTCSQIVTDQILKFGVDPKKFMGQYREWIRDTERYEKYQHLVPATDNSFLFIGHKYDVMQKRADLLVKAFQKIRKRHRDAILTVIGRGWPAYFKDFDLDGITITGETYILEPYLEKSTFYVHPGELEASGLAVLESMVAGLIPLISDKTGLPDAAKNVDERLIFSLDEIEEKLEWVIALSPLERQTLSQKARMVGISYSAENSIPFLRKELLKVLKLSQKERMNLYEH